jgi:hypothetical protein
MIDAEVSMRPLSPALVLALAACSGSVSGPSADGPRAGDGPLAIADGPIADARAGGDGGPVGGCVPGLTALALAPADSTVQLDGSTPAPIVFTATGTIGGLAGQAVATSALSFSASRDDDTAAGTFTGATLAPNGQAGGTVNVRATDGCVVGTTTVRFVLSTTVGTPSSPGAWDGTPVGGGAPTVVYPSDQTRFPRNIHRTLFQWRTGASSAFRLTFDGPAARVVVYTDGAHPLCAGKAPVAGCWEADAAAWSLIAGSNAGQAVTVTVDGLDTSGAAPVVRRAPPITIAFSKRDVRGAIFYWSTTSAGIRRANVASAAPDDYVAGKPATVYGDGTSVKCVACHVVSRDGKYLVAPLDSTTAKGLTIFDVTLAAPPTIARTVAGTTGHGFATISPDDSSVVAAFAGKMWQLDRATGDHLVDLPLGGGKGTHPDWSPDGTRLVYASAAGDAPAGAGIALLGHGGGTTWTGPPTVLVPAAGKTNLFPAFSPDGNWIAYTRGKGGHDDVTAQLFLVAANPGATPVELVNANRVVSNALGDGQHANSQPTWAPAGDVAWIAFNSERAYGVVTPEGTQQIWVAAVDLGKASGDPSFPAFRLQFQGLTENNHRAYWTTDIREPPPTPDAGVRPDAPPMACTAALDACDPVLSVCCDAGYVCDSNDDGATYHCYKQIQ